MRAPPVRLPWPSNTVSAPPRWAASWVRTRSGGSTTRQHGQVARARDTVPLATSLSVCGSNISNSTRGGTLSSRTTLGRSAHLRLGFWHSHMERIRGISAPQLGASQRTVRAHR